jgi:hypothetical protein
MTKVPKGRLKVVQDCVAVNFQPSPFDKLRVIPSGAKPSEFLTHLLHVLSRLLCMPFPLALRFSGFAVVSALSLAAMNGQTGTPHPSAACPAQPNTLRAMRGCYRPLLVFAPSLDNPQLVQEFNQLKAHAIELKSRSVLYVPIVPEGHNQPIPRSNVPTARLSEDELAAMRHRFKVEPPDFLVILIGKDGEEKLSNKNPVPVDQIEHLIDSMPMRKIEKRPEPQGEE